jgi:DNA polymerase-3 subunit epsilon
MNFVTIDFETGMYARESAVSVGLVKYLDGQAADSYYSLIRPPELYIRADFTAIHGLTVDDVRDAPVFADIWERDILPFIGCLPLAAHNAEFDMGVLRAVLVKYEIALPKLRYFCTLKIARKTWPSLSSHALTALGKHFGITYEAHNALADARTCGDIVLLAAQKYCSGSLRSLLRTAGVGLRILDKKIPQRPDQSD